MRLEAQVFEGPISVAGMDVGLQARVFIKDGKIVGVRSLRLVGEDGLYLPRFVNGTIEVSEDGSLSEIEP